LKLNPIYIYILITLSMIFWGFSFIWSKIVLDYYEPITILVIRLLLSSVILFAGLRIFNRLQKIRKEDYNLFLISSLLNPFLYFLGENYGLKYSSPTITAVLIATIPLFTPILGYISFREKLSKFNIFGLFISFAGVIFMLVDKNFAFSTSPTGMAWLLLAVVSATFYAVFLKKLALKYDAFMIIAVQNLIGAVYFLPLFFIFDFQQFITVVPNTEVITSLLLLAFFASSLAFVFFTIGTREIGISKTGLFTNLIPVFTAVFSFLILSEQFEVQKVAGMMLALLGVLMSQVTGQNIFVTFYRFIFYRRKNNHENR
jgi:drug/metabolite transporter (DMT)-like permease